MVRAGRRPPREDGHRHQALRRHARLAERHVPVGAQHPAAPATRRCVGCRPTTSTSTRCTTSTGRRRGTRSGRRWTTLVQQGKVLYVGSSNFAGWHIAKAQEAANRRHFTGLVSEQSLYNLLERTSSSRCCPPRRTTASASSRGRPLHGGLLGGIIAQAGPAAGRRAGARRRRSRSTASAIEAYEAFCDELGRGAGRRRRSRGCCTSPR